MTSEALQILDSRLRRLEDESAIQRLIASYGPCVDAANADGAAALWEADGSYDVEGWRMNGSDDVRAMVGSPSHHELVAGGCCHFLGPAVVTVAGDTAVAVCESLVLLRLAQASPERLEHVAWRKAPSEYVVWRAAANHLQLQRGADGWRIVARTTRMLDGSPSAHALLTGGLAGATAGEAMAK